MLKLTREMICPCESGKKLKECCLRPKGKVRPSHIKIKTSGSKTGYGHPSCYAKSLGDCSEKISGEHYITHGILKKFISNGNVRIKGVPWIEKGSSKSLPAKKLRSNILCKRHNEALSPLDSVSIRILDCLEKIDKASVSEDAEEKIYLFNGYDIERWMLKTVCGVLFSRNGSMTGKQITDWSPPLHWVQILFENKAFPKNTGLFYAGKVGQKENTSLKFDFMPLSDEVSDIDGAHFRIRFLQFILAMTPTDGKQHKLFDGSTFRPGEFLFNTKYGQQAIMLWWKFKGEEKGVEIAYG